MLLEKREYFHNLVAFNPLQDRIQLFDFTENNTSLTPYIYNDTEAFTKYVRDELTRTNSKFGIGGYLEARGVYSRSGQFDVAGQDEPRRLHLGIDIWGKPHTPVMAPLNGIVHSFAFNNNFGDYGATIVLTHQVERQYFYTLYGHLSLNSIKNLDEGQLVKAGDVIGEFGIPAENGDWPPHVHFQIVKDMDNWKGDYPGVCRVSEKGAYISNCPDPDIILQMMQYAKSDY